MRVRGEYAIETHRERERERDLESVYIVWCLCVDYIISTCSTQCKFSSFASCCW